MPNTNPVVASTTLKPGYLVSLKTSVIGNVSYAKEIIEPEHRVRGGAEKAIWQTERTIAVPEEFKKAHQARLKARMAIVNVCARSAFGLLCPKADLVKLNEATAEANRIADAFNRTATLTTVSVYVLSGEIAQNDVQAVRAINAEVRGLLKTMSEGVKTLNVKTIREAASRTNSLLSMITPDAAAGLKGAIGTARKAARKISKAGEDAATEIDREAIRAIGQARTAFLDMSDAVEVEAPDSTARGMPDIEPEAPIRRRRITAEV